MENHRPTAPQAHGSVRMGPGLPDQKPPQTGEPAAPSTKTEPSAHKELSSFSGNSFHCGMGLTVRNKFFFLTYFPEASPRLALRCRWRGQVWFCVTGHQIFEGS